MKPMISDVASSIPFDNTGINFNSTDVQAALLEARDHSVWDAETRATTAAGTFTMTAANLSMQFLTGASAGYNVQLPDATTLFIGTQYQIVNQSSKTVQIKDGSGANLFLLGQTSIGFIILQINSTTSGTWVYYQTSINFASGIVSYNVISSTNFTTSSGTDTAITAFTQTPQAGTYVIFYSAENSCPGSGVDNVCTIYKGGVAITDSLRHATSPAGSHTFQMNTMTISQFDGSTACTVDVSTTSSITVGQRSLILIRLGT
jgi:hypothetical protein